MYKLGGLAVQNLLLAVDKMNVNVIFLKPSLRPTEEAVLHEVGNLAARRSDFVIGSLPLLPLYLSAWFQPTTPYEYTAA